MHPFRHSISSVCIAAAWADGEVDDLEKQALDRIHVQLGFSRPEIMEIIGQALQSGPTGESIEIPEDPALQREYMRLALAVCFADGGVNQHEVNFLAQLATFLNMPTAVMMELRGQAESLLRPHEANTAENQPERMKALLPDQVIRLDDASHEAAARNRQLELEKARCRRKPLSELLYEGQDYGGEIKF